MNYYEKVVILEPTLGDEEINEVSEKIKNLISKAGGEVLKEDRWGRRALAYELNRKTQGYYMLYTFKAPPAAIKKMEEFLKVFDPVFRYMVVKLGSRQVADLIEQLKKSALSTKQAGEPDSSAQAVQAV